MEGLFPNSDLLCQTPVRCLTFHNLSFFTVAISHSVYGQVGRAGSQVPYILWLCATALSIRAIGKTTWMSLFLCEVKDLQLSKRFGLCPASSETCLVVCPSLPQAALSTYLGAMFPSMWYEGPGRSPEGCHRQGFCVSRGMQHLWLLPTELSLVMFCSLGFFLSFFYFF